jgi:hypothetical protein
VREEVARNRPEAEGLAIGSCEDPDVEEKDAAGGERSHALNSGESPSGRGVDEQQA